MPLANSNTLLDLNGLAYYHSKIKDMIKDAMGIKVNVTQSNGQTLSYRVYGGHDTEFYPDNLTVDDEIEDNWGFYPLSDSFREYISIAIELTPDEGFNAGSFILNIDGGEPLQEIEYGSGESGDYTVEYYSNSFHTGLHIPRGSTLNISATPASPILNMSVKYSNGSIIVENTGDYDLSNIVISCSDTGDQFTIDSLLVGQSQSRQISSIGSLLSLTVDVTATTSLGNTQKQFNVPTHNFNINWYNGYRIDYTLTWQEPNQSQQTETATACTTGIHKDFAVGTTFTLSISYTTPNPGYGVSSGSYPHSGTITADGVNRSLYIYAMS